MRWDNGILVLGWNLMNVDTGIIDEPVRLTTGLKFYASEEYILALRGATNVSEQWNPCSRVKLSLIYVNNGSF